MTGPLSYDGSPGGTIAGTVAGTLGGHAGDRPTLDIDLGAVRRNWAKVQAAAAARTTIGAVVKCDAYGLGAGRIVPLLHGLGCRDFWVANIDEAAACASDAPGSRLYVLNGLSGAGAGEFRRNGFIPVLASFEEIEAAGAEARRSGRLRVAIQLDTGLRRLGLNHGEVRRAAATHGLFDGLEIVLWATHLAFFADPDRPENAEQRRRLAAWLARLPAAPVSFVASSGLFAGQDWPFDHARIGSALYGINTIRDRDVGLDTVATLSAPILRVAAVPAGAGVGYHGLYHARSRRRLATVALGYGDGVPPQLGNRGRVLVDGIAAPIVGGIAMGLMSVDVTGLPEEIARPGARVVLYGAEQRLEAVAALAGVAPNVLLTGTVARAIRRYRDDPPVQGAEAGFVDGTVSLVPPAVAVAT